MQTRKKWTTLSGKFGMYQQFLRFTSSMRLPTNPYWFSLFSLFSLSSWFAHHTSSSPFLLSTSQLTSLLMLTHKKNKRDTAVADSQVGLSFGSSSYSMQKVEVVAARADAATIASNLFPLAFGVQRPLYGRFLGFSDGNSPMSHTGTFEASYCDG
jgi:hypothetical protein